MGKNTVTEKIVSFRDLEVWRESHALVLDIYALTHKLPAGERFGLSSQMRRAGVSVPANIAEGFKRKGKSDKCNFYNMAAASLEEVRYYLILVKDLGYIKDVGALEGSALTLRECLRALPNR